jgi:hypothetical protein
MKLVKLLNGEPVAAGPSVKFTLSADESELLLECSCGTMWTARVPAEGKRTESLCPRGCGGGVDIDRRPQLEFLDGLPPDLPPIEDTLRGLTYTADFKSIGEAIARSLAGLLRMPSPDDE